ncbi:MAG: alpha/beta hydrolase [Bacteroidales bacterium]|jgi:acetyl esterase/lipase|nr:alpha/beta hydrolase [Bacteroidales bacterium]
MKFIKKICLFAILGVLTQNVLLAVHPKPVYIWKTTTSMSKQPTRLYAYYPSDSNNKNVSVIICPGGSYHHLGLQHEGHDVAQFFAKQGFTAYVLRYRVSMYGYHHPAMLEDVQMAIHYVRQKHEQNTALGVVGFSAGGHLALMAGVFAQQNYLQSFDIENVSNLSPDFIAAVYPVVSMQDSLVHLWSRKSLLGKHFTETEKEQFSLELQIPNNMPPVFIVAAKDDNVVKYQNSTNLDKALNIKNIEHFLDIYEKGGHGFGMSEKKGGKIALWREKFLIWLQQKGTI